MRRTSDEIVVGRGDPVYMAHAYLTKVPVPAIVPFIEAYSPKGGVVADPFAGSGMTGVAAVACGRNARLSDISVLGRHIGSNYLNLVNKSELQTTAELAIKEALSEIGGLYTVSCEACDGKATLSKSVWSVLVECSGCAKALNYYHVLEKAGWFKPAMKCPHCETVISSKDKRVGEEPVIDSITCSCSKNQLEQPAGPVEIVDVGGLDFPHVEITPDRQMYHASALGKSGNTTVASYYSPRNRRALVALRAAIQRVKDENLAAKLLFAFTATLTRASKRYQWSKARPLNAANANYYIAPVFYEWNVFELFERKVVAVTRSDDYIRGERVARKLEDTPVDSEYRVESAEKLSLADDSVDYVFTDPPFGSNLFYADMALFQEGWLGGFTDVTKEAVIDRSRGTSRGADRYERLLTDALKECRRVLKPGGRVSMVFGNSSGKVWALVQRAVAAAGLTIEPELIVILNKGQRSVKGLASGFEHVATLDLVLTMTESTCAAPEVAPPTAKQLAALTRKLAGSQPMTPSHLYLKLLRSALRDGWSVAELDLRAITEALIGDGWQIDEKKGTLTRSSNKHSSRDDAP